MAKRRHSEDDVYDMRGTRMRASQDTMHTISIGGGRIIQGGVSAAHDLERLRRDNVKLVINCTNNVPFPPWAQEPGTPELDIFAVCGREVRSRMRRGEEILPMLEPLFARIQHHLSSRQNVMIHCRAGVHRAGTMGVILAMHLLSLNPRDALRHVRKRRRLTNVCGDNWEVVLRVAAEMEDRWQQGGLSAAPAAPATYQERLSAAPAAPATPQERFYFSAAPAAPAEPENPLTPRSPLAPRAAPKFAPKSPLAPGAAPKSAPVRLVSLSSSESEPEVVETANPESPWSVHDDVPSVVLRPALPVLPANPAPVVYIPVGWSPAQAPPVVLSPAQAQAPVVLSPAQEPSSPPAAPAAAEEEPQTRTAPGARLTYAEAVGRLLFMSWNPGAGARQLAKVIDTTGYHVVAVQEAREDFLTTLDPQRWSYVINYQQFLGARFPNWVESHCGEEIQNKIRWHFATVHFSKQRVGRDSLGILSLHLNNNHAKKPVAGIQELGRAIDQACGFSPSHTVDVICGDLNMARWKKSNDGEYAEWHEGTFNELELRGFMPVADYVNECCFVAVHDSIAQTLHIKGSSWGERSQRLDPDQREAFHKDFLQKVGAKKTSHDVHWPMSLALRVATSARASGLRQRTAEATERRNERKRQRGYLPPRRPTGSAASYSGSAAPAAPADWASDSGWYGRSSGSATSSSWGWHSHTFSSWHGRSSGSGEWSGSWHSDPNWHSRSWRS